MPGPVGGRAHGDIGHDRLDRSAAECPAGLGVEAPDFRHHVGDVFVIDVAELAQPGEIPLCEQRQILDQDLHCGVVPVLLTQLDGEAFRQIAGTHAGWVEALDDPQHRLHARNGRSQPLCDILDACGQISAILDGIDDRVADHPVHRIGTGQRELSGKMVAQCRRGGDIGFKIAVLAVLAPTGGAGP